MRTIETTVARAGGGRLAIRLDKPEHTSIQQADMPIVVSCHGLFGSLRGTKNVLLREVFVRAGFLFAALDFSAHGESAGRLETLTLEQLHSDLGALITHLRGVTGREPLRYGLIGSSLGGRIALTHAMRHPGEVDAVVVFAPVLDPAGKSPLTGESGEILPLFRDIFAEDIYEQTDAIQCPLCIIHGRDDELLPVADSERFARKLTGRAAPWRFFVTSGDHQFTTPEMREPLADLSLAWHTLYTKYR